MDGRSYDLAQVREQNRRFPRLRARCRVRVRDRHGEWDAETEDVGPRGCRIVTDRAQTVGALLGLTVESDSLRETLEVTGQVVWAARDAASRAGISFAGSASRPGAPGPGAWFAALAAAAGAVEAVGGQELVPSEDGFDVPVDEEPSTGSPSELAQRLVERARELLGSGAGGAAVVILRRAAALVPDDATIAAMLVAATTNEAV
jgi:hypothetical protein